MPNLKIFQNHVNAILLFQLNDKNISKVRKLITIIKFLIIPSIYKYYAYIQRLKSLAIDWFLKILCILQRLSYKIKLRSVDIYKWHLSSLLSITHRIVGVVNFFSIILICIWTVFIIFGQNNYQTIYNIFNSTFGKFLIISLCWTFSFHILNELRHLIWDAGYGFDLKVAKITGIVALAGSFVLTILFYLLGRSFF